MLKSILFFSLPYLLSYFLQTLYGMADLFIIGQFEGVASTTAVSIGSQVMHMITVMIVGLAVVNEKEYILVTLGAPGNHATEQTNIMDAVQVYRILEKKK